MPIWSKVLAIFTLNFVVLEFFLFSLLNVFFPVIIYSFDEVIELFVHHSRVGLSLERLCYLTLNIGTTPVGQVCLYKIQQVVALVKNPSDLECVIAELHLCFLFCPLHPG